MTGRRILRFAIALLALVAALCGCLAALLASGLLEAQLGARAAAFLQQATGHPVRIERVRLRLWAGSVELAGVRIGGEAPALFAADAVRVGWQWRPLLGRRIVLDDLCVTRPDVRLSLAGGGGSASPAPDLSRLVPFLPPHASPADWELSPFRVRLEDGTVSWIGRDGRPGTLEGFEGEIAWGSGQGGLQVSLDAERLAIPLGPETHLLERPRLRAEVAPHAVAIREFSGTLLGFPLKVAGRLSDLDTVPRLDLQAAGEMALAEVARLAGTPNAPEGRLALRARILGAWDRPVAAGDGTLSVGPAASGAPLDFRFRWADGRIHAASSDAGRRGTAAGTTLLVDLSPASGEFRARLTIGGLDLQAIRGIPAMLARAAGIAVPPEARGCMTASADLFGRGADLEALRGRATLSVDGFAWGEDFPAGRLAGDCQATAAWIRCDDLALSLPGGRVRGRGTFVPETGALEVPMRLEVEDAGQFARAFGWNGAGGTGHLDGRISGTREAPRFEGWIAWRRVRLGDLALDRLDGAVLFGGRELSTPGLDLRVGQSAATIRGRLAATGSAPLAGLDLRRDLAVDLAFDAAGRTADLARFLPAGLKLSAAGRASGRLGGTPSALFGEAALALQDLSIWGEEWQRGVGTLRFRPGHLEVSGIALQRGAERVQGDLVVAPGGQVRGQFSSEALDLSRISWLAGLGLAGEAALSVALAPAGDALRIGGTARAEALGFRGLDIGPADADFSIERGAVEVRLAFRGGTHRLHLWTTAGPAATLQADLSLHRASLAWLLRAATVSVPAGGEAEGDGLIRFRAPLGELARGTAEAKFGRLRVQFKGELLESLGPLRLAWRDGVLTVLPARFRARGGEVAVRGAVSREGRGDLQIAGTLPLIALADAAPALRVAGGAARLDLVLRGPLDAPTLEGNIAVVDGSVAIPPLPEPLTGVSAAVRLAGDTVRVAELRGQLAGGSVRASGEIRLREDTGGFAVEYAIAGARAERLLAGAHTGRAAAPTGTLDIAGRLSGGGGDVSALRRSLSGEARLELRDGRFGRYTVLAKVLALTDIALLFNPASLELRGKGLPYRRITGDLQIRNGSVGSENLFLDSPAFQASAVGRMDLAEETLDVTLAIRPFQRLDSALARIPMASWLLESQEGSLVVAYARASGSMWDPQVEALPRKSISGPLWGIFRDRLNLPEGARPPEASQAPIPEGEERRDR
jgi:uncharacterized protein involved in outer membrane biogenesis